MATNTEQLLAYLQTPGLTDTQIANEVNRLGVSAAQVSQLTGVPVAEVQSRLATPTNTVGRTVTADDTGGGGGGGGGGGATTPTFGTSQETALYNFLQTPGLTDKQIAGEVNRLGLKADQISKMTGVPVNEINARLNLISTQTAADAKAAADATALANSQAALNAANARAAEAARLAGLNKTTTGNQANFSTFTNWLKSTPGLTDQQIAAEMNRLGISNSQVADLTGVGLNDVNTRFNAVAPFSNATQGFAQNFNNYQSIPIGAQYNPGVTAGGASPYSQVMGQMRPVGNPYAGVVGNLSMGGYNPGLYDQIAATNAAKAAAAAAATGNTVVESGGDGPSGPDGGGTGAGAGTGNAMAKGGYVHGGLMFGPNPKGPDDGAVNLDIGEYVIKKSSVNKYGRGLLDMINEGKVPAKKMKSLLG
jgi:bacterioferritin-associated ferredoxin